MDSEEAIEPVWDRHELDPPAFSTFPRRRPSLKPVSHSAHHLLVWDIYSKLITRLNMGGEGVSFSPLLCTISQLFWAGKCSHGYVFPFQFFPNKMHCECTYHHHPCFPNGLQQIEQAGKTGKRPQHSIRTRFLIDKLTEGRAEVRPRQNFNYSIWEINFEVCCPQWESFNYSISGLWKYQWIWYDNICQVLEMVSVICITCFFISLVSPFSVSQFFSLLF